MVRQRTNATFRQTPQQRRRVRHTLSEDSSSSSYVHSNIPISQTALRCLVYFCAVLFLVILLTVHGSLPQPSSSASSSRGRLRDAFRRTTRIASSTDTNSDNNANTHPWHWSQRFQTTLGGLLPARSPSRTASTQRIAIVLPFIGKGAESIPPYLSLFCSAAAGAASLVDFLIFHPGVLETYAERTGQHVCPPNVKFINLQSMEHLASKYLLRLMDHIPEDEWVLDNRDMMARILTKHLLAYPYALVEYKPTFGHVFADFLVDYTHWGYSDLDIVFGDLSRWITKDELNDYDIVTYGYGDQNRVYLRGQFTFHRNTPKVNAIWRKCEYLSRLDQRFGKVLAGEQKLKFESAEGCYSAAVLDRQDIRVKYATKAFTDTQESDPVYSHGLYIARQKNPARKRNFLSFHQSSANRGDDDHSVKNVVIYKAKSKEEGKDLLHSSHNWFERDTIYKDPTQPLQYEVGRKEVIELNDPDSNANCMYWAQKKYQSRLCVSSNVTENDTVFWVNGRLYKQRYENAKLDTNVDTAPFFHFQEWKRFYREGQLAAFRPDSDFSTFVLTKEGAIPVHYREVGNTPLAQLSSDIKSPLGNAVFHWKAGNVDVDRKLLPLSSYCLISAPRKFPPVPPAPQCSQQSSWWDEEQVHILSMAPAWQTDLDPKLDVTLVLTQQIPIYQSSDSAALNSLLDLAIANLNRWQGQACVLIFHVAVDDEGHKDDVLSLMEARFSGTTNGSSSSKSSGHANDADPDAGGSETSTSPLFGIDNCLIAVVFSNLTPYTSKKKGLPASYHVSRKALINMAIDAVPTRWFLSGIELERGMMLSMDAAFFSHRAAMSHQNIPGNIFWIPQFALDVEDDFDEVLTLSNLIEFHGKGEIVKEAIDFEKGFCEGDDGRQQKDNPERIFDDLTKIWWEMAEKIVEDESSYVEDEALTEKRARIQDDLQLRLAELLASERHYDLFAMDESPILLTDNQGPHNGILTNQIAREVEEFGGKLCYNALRMAQLATLGYTFNVLPGAFAASMGTSRADANRNSVHSGGLGDEDEAMLGGSRCDGCFMFDEEHESILEGIAKDERKRPAKTAVLFCEEREAET